MNLSCANLTREVILDHLFDVYLTFDQVTDNFIKMPFTQSYPPLGPTIYADYEVMPGSLRLIVTGINYQLRNLSDVMIVFK